MAPYRIELRSDTQTVPTPDMREAMAMAEVADEQWGEDPTVLELERTCADMFGREAAVFVPSGTMGNLTSMLALTGRGDTVIVDGLSHMVGENGNYAVVAGCTLLPVETDGVLDADMVRERLDSATIPPARPALIWTENTHNVRGGVSWGPEVMQGIVELAAERGMRVHLDGARIFNAAHALETDAATIAALADTVSFCFSKGLGAPVGSVLTGPREVIDRARVLRRQLGGGMRQAGVIAAAALHALEHHVERLADDHAHASHLADGLAALPGVVLDPAAVDTNIVFFELDDSLDGIEFRERLAAEGVLCSGTGPQRVRMVTHLDVDGTDIDAAVAAAERVVDSMQAA